MAKTFVLPVSFSTTVTLSTEACKYIQSDMEELAKSVREYEQSDSMTKEEFCEANSIPLGRAVAMVSAYEQGGVERVFTMCVRNGLTEVLNENWVLTKGDEKFRVSPVKVG